MQKQSHTAGQREAWLYVWKDFAGHFDRTMPVSSWAMGSETQGWKPTLFSAESLLVLLWERAKRVKEKAEWCEMSTGKEAFGSVNKEASCCLLPALLALWLSGAGGDLLSSLDFVFGILQLHFKNLASCQVLCWGFFLANFTYFKENVIVSSSVCLPFCLHCFKWKVHM